MSEQVANSESAGKLDPAQQRLGAIYADALLAATEKAGQTEEVLAELDSFVHEILDDHPKFEAILNSGIVSSDEKKQIIERAVGGKVSALLSNFLKVLAAHARLNAIRVIQRVAHDRLNTLRGRVRVDVTTATPLDESLTNQLKERLRGMLKREPVLTSHIDPEVIGGLIVRVGDTVYDGSVATELDRLGGQIVHRSVHEIQSRRDRFSYPAGN